LGKSLTDQNVVIVSYVLSKGPDSNKVNSFSILDSVGGLTSATVIPKSAAAGGASAESIQNIKFSAPKSYVAQNRAVTKEDYISLIIRISKQ